MEEERLKAILESLLFAAGEPVSLARLAAVLDNVPRDAIRKALTEMALDYSSTSRGLRLEEVAGGYQLRTAQEHAPYVRKLLQSKPPRLSRPLLETLAIIAYRQPITRPEIEELRGVDSAAVLETILERRLARIAGRKEAPGRPAIYATTPEFLEFFGLKSLESLPDLEEFRQLEDRGPAGESTQSGEPASIEVQAADLARHPGAADAVEPQIDTHASHGVPEPDADKAAAAEDQPDSSERSE